MPSFNGIFSSDIIRSPWVLAPAAFALWMLVLVVAKTVVLGAMRRFAMRTAWSWDDVLVRALSLPLLIAIAASGLVVFDRILPLSPEWDRAFDVMLAGAIVLALVLFVDRACRGIVERLAARTRILQGAQGLIQGSVRGMIIALGLLVFGQHRDFHHTHSGLVGGRESGGGPGPPRHARQLFRRDPHGGGQAHRARASRAAPER